MIVEDDSILTEENTLEYHLVPLSGPGPLVTKQRITSPDYITYNSKLDWMRDGYATAVLGNFLFVGGGYNPADGEPNY